MSDREQAKIIAQNLKQLLFEAGKTQKDLANDLGVSPQVVNTWCRGIAVPRMGKIQALADYFNVEKSEIIDVHTTVEETSNKENISKVLNNNIPAHFRIPVLGHVAAGVPIEMIEDIIDWEDLPKTEFKEPEKEYFGLKIKGHSMEPRICDGDVVIVHEQADAETDQIVIATIDGKDATCKRLKKYQDSIALISNNPAYEPMIFTADQIKKMPIEIRGVVVELRGKF